MSGDYLHDGFPYCLCTPCRKERAATARRPPTGGADAIDMLKALLERLERLNADMRETLE